MHRCIDSDLKMVATQQIADIVELAEVLLLHKENQLPETYWSIRETYPRTQNLISIFFPRTDPFGRRIGVGFNLDFEDPAADELLTAARTLYCCKNSLMQRKALKWESVGLIFQKYKI